MADQKLTALTELTAPAIDDILYVVDDIAGSPTSKKVSVNNLLSQSLLGAALYPISSEETAAGVTPSDYAYPTGHIKRYGAVGDYSTDDTEAFKTAALIGGSLFIPVGTYKITETINIKLPINWYGPGSYKQIKSRSQLIFADDIVGLFFHSSDTNADSSGIPVIEASTTSAQGSTLKNIVVQRGFSGSIPINPDLTSMGIWVKTPVYFTGVLVSGFQCHNIYVRASTGSTDPTIKGNANVSYFEQIRVQNAGHDGFRLDGLDANGCTLVHVDATNNTDYGIFDASFLGNTHIGHHTAGNNIPYSTNNVNARSIFVGCYSEGGGQNASEYSEKTIVIGGIQASGVAAEGTSRGPIYLYNDGAMPSLDRLRFSATPGSTNDYTVTFGALADTPIRVVADDGAGGGLELRFPFWNETDQMFSIDCGTANNNSALSITTDNSTGQTMGRSAPLVKGMPVFRSGLWLGEDDLGRHLNVGSAAPTSGDYSEGDIVFNRSPSAGGTVGWVCVTAGSPGTWKTFGSIAA